MSCLIDQTELRPTDLFFVILRHVKTIEKTIELNKFIKKNHLASKMELKKDFKKFHIPQKFYLEKIIKEQVKLYPLVKCIFNFQESLSKYLMGKNLNYLNT